MDRVFIRNFFLFVILLLLCAGTLFYTLIAGERTLSKTDTLVTRTYDIILKAEEISSEVEAMLAAQRGFLITRSNTFKIAYEQRKATISESIARLAELIDNNPSQISRLNEIRFYFNQLTLKLEDRAAWSETVPNVPRAPGEPPEISLNNQLLGDLETINNLKDNIERLNATFLSEEYKLLEYRVKAVNEKKSQYFNSLLVGVVVGTALLLLFNSFLLAAQRKRSLIETNLKVTETRYKLAVDGANDGIFDWDIKTGEVFYSKAYFRMLGYEDRSLSGTMADFEHLLHPEDKPYVWEQIDKYIAAEIPDYIMEFRLKRADGTWAWIQARAKGMFNDKNQAFRIVGAHTDITFLKEKQEKLEIEKQQAEEANQAKSDFLAHMSHEIRTPLTAISGIAEILSNNQGNLHDRQKQLINTLSSSTSSLKDLINDILDFSKIQSGELDLIKEPFALNNLFESVISMMALRANEKGINFIFDYKDVDSEEFDGDPVRLRQILVNLIGNALKFTEVGGVTVKAYHEEREGADYMRIDVTDTGIGIAPEHFDLIFERFKQADASVSRKYGGTGLGLSISKKLAELMGGTITLSSQQEKGSSFSLLLPFHTPKHKIVPKAPKAGSLKELPRINPVDDMQKLLLVEDYEGNIVVLGYILDDLGLAYDIARTGKEGLKLWQEHSYALILMDVQMPEMDGFTATRKIREEEEQRKLGRTPIIGMTAHALVGDKDKCIAAGMDAYLPKPIVESELKRQIMKFLNEGRSNKVA